MPSMDIVLIFFARGLRTFAYGGLAVILLLYLNEQGLNESEIGTLLTSIVVGDLFISLYLTSHADSTLGRRRTLMLGAVLMCGAGIGFAYSGSYFPALLISGTLGVISGTGGEIGPFLPVEQAALCECMQGKGTEMGPLLGYYNGMGYFCAAFGAVCCGWAVTVLQSVGGWPPSSAHRAILVLYAGLGALKGLLYAFLGPGVEAGGGEKAAGASSGSGSSSSGGSTGKDATPAPLKGEGGVLFAPPAPSLGERVRGWVGNALGLHSPSTQWAVGKLSALFVLDSFAGGLVMQTYMVIWFYRVWGWEEGYLGSLMMAANILGGVSSVLAGHLVTRFGPVKVAVFTHLPSNILLACVPLMPTGDAAGVMLLLRFCLSQMDVPARQALVQSLVEPSERSAAGGVTNVIRSLGLSAAPLLLGYLTAQGKGEGVGEEGSRMGALSQSRWGPISYPFFIAAGLKIIYDLSLFQAGTALASERASQLKAGGGGGGGGGRKGGVRKGKTGAAKSFTATVSAESGVEGGKDPLETTALTLEVVEEDAERGEEGGEGVKEEEEEEGGEGGIKLGPEVTESEGLLGKLHAEEVEEAGQAWGETIDLD